MLVLGLILLLVGLALWLVVDDVQATKVGKVLAAVGAGLIAADVLIDVLDAGGGRGELDD